MSRIHAVVGSGTAPDSVIKEGLRDVLESDDIVVIPWYGKPTPGLAAVYDYVLDNSIDFIMYHDGANLPAKAFATAESGSLICCPNVDLGVIASVASGGKVLVLWDATNEAAMEELINNVFDNISEKTLTLELTNGLAPISLSLLTPEPVDEVDPTDDSPKEFTREELSIMPVGALKRLAESKGLPTGVTGKGNYIKVILGEELSLSALPPADTNNTNISEDTKMPTPIVIGVDDLKRSLADVTPSGTQVVIIDLLRTRGIEFGTAILEHVPTGRHRSLAITALEDALDRAVKGILTNA